MIYPNTPDGYIAALAAAGGDETRLWIAPSQITVESPEIADTSFSGATAGRVEYLPAAPIVSDSLVVDGYAGPWRYNHDSAIVSFDGRLYVLWNATTDGYEGGSNQVILQSVSNDEGLTWSAPVRPFSDPEHCTNPISATGRQQWQPSVIAHEGRILAIWDVTGNLTATYFSTFDPRSGKWTNRDIGATLLPVSLSDTEAEESYGRLASQTAIYALESGRLLCPMILHAEAASFATDRKRMVSLYSDDDGATWALGAPCGPAGDAAGAWEPYITERAGVLTAYMRRITTSTDNRQSQWTAQSTDGGETWSSPRSSGWDIAATRGASCRLPDGRWAIVHHHHTEVATNPRNRRSLSVWLSDGGMTAVPAYCISGTRRGQSWSYPAVCVHKGKLAVVSSRAEIGDGSVRQIGVTVCAIPTGYACSPAGQSQLKITPDLAGGVLKFGGGESRYTYAGSVAGWASTAISICIAGSIGHRWGRVAASSPDGALILFDNRVGTAGLALQIGNGATGADSNLLHLEYYSSGSLIEQVTSIRLPDSGKYALFVSLSGTSLTATMVAADGTVTTDAKTLASTPTGYALPPAIYCATSGTWAGVYGDVSAAAVYDSALTVNQMRQWHATYGVRYGLPAWSGSVSALPGSNVALLDPQGAIASWPTPGQAPASYALSGKDLTAAGLYSIPVPTPLERSGTIKLRYKALGGRVNATPIVTIGDVGRYISVYKLTDNRLRVLDSVQDDGTFLGVEYKSNQPEALSDGTWYSLTIRFDGDYCYIEHDRCAPIRMFMPSRPLVFLGWGWRYTTKTASIDTDKMVFDVSSIGYSLATQKPTDINEGMQLWTPLLKFGGGSTGVAYVAGVRGYYRIADGFCDAYFDVRLTSKGSSTGVATLEGLPIPSKNSAGLLHFGGALSVQSGMAATINQPIQFRAQSSVFYFMLSVGGGQSDLTDAHFTDSSIVRGHVRYPVQG